MLVVGPRILESFARITSVNTIFAKNTSTQTQRERFMHRIPCEFSVTLVF